MTRSHRVWHLRTWLVLGPLLLLLLSAALWNRPRPTASAAFPGAGAIQSGLLAPAARGDAP